jgi:hypothetical protein
MRRKGKEKREGEKRKRRKKRKEEAKGKKDEEKGTIKQLIPGEGTVLLEKGASERMSAGLW